MTHFVTDGDVEAGSSWWGQVTARAGEREAARQMATREARRSWDHVERAVRSRLPTLLPDFANMLLGALLGFWVLAWLLERYVGAPHTWVLPAFGMLYALQAAWYGVRLEADPTFKVPRCGCAGGARDNPDAVLRSAYSRVGGVPNAVLAALSYLVFMVLLASGHHNTATVLAGVSVVAGGWLGYVMVVRIRALCANCVSIFAVNLLLLTAMLRG
jgi:uncharacterized membrane protein